MRILVWVLIGLVAIAALIAGGAYLVLSGYDRGQLKQLAQDQAEAATGRNLTIGGDLDFKISLTPAITVDDVRFGNASWGSREDMATMKRFELEVALIPLLTGSLQITRLVLIEPDIFLETDASGRTNWDLNMPASDPQAETGAMALQVDEIVIRDGKVTYRDGVTGETSLFALDRLSGSAPSAQQLNVDANGDADGTPFSLTARLTQSGDNYSIDNADIAYGGTDLKGSGSLALGGTRPNITANFTSNTVDLTAFGTTGEEADATAETGAASAYVFTEDPLPIGVLRSVDADIDIAADTIKVTDNVDVTGAKIALTLNNGDLNLTELSGASMEGTVNMTARLNGATTPARMSTDLKVRGLNYGEVLKTFDISESVDGNIDFTVDLRGSGNSMRAITSGLNGYTELVATDGIITNQLLAVVSTGLDSIVGPLFGGKDKTSLKCAIARYDLSNGVANTRAMVVDSDTFTLTGTGRADLRSEQLKLKFDTKTRETALVSLAVPFRVEGTLASPTAYPDPLGSVDSVVGVVDSVGSLFGGSKDDGEKKGGFGALGGLLGKVTGNDRQQDAGPTGSAQNQDACAAAMAAIGR
ncbi:MAG: AsmA family protein [Alphaproteobacteria bacterium]